MDQPNTPVTIEDVVALLRDDRMRGYKIDVETDQMIEADENAEKQRRVEFLTAIGQMLQQAAGVMNTPMGPPLAPMIASGIKFTARGFKAGREMEESIENSFDALMQQLSQPQQPKEDPAAQAKAQAEMQKAMVEKQRVDIEQAKAQQEMRLAQEKHEAEMQRLLKHEMRADAETELKVRDHELKDRSQREDMDARRAEQGLRARIGENGEVSETLTAEDFRMDQLHDLMAQNLATTQMIGQGLAQLAQAHASPKRVVRDESGRPIGIEPIPPQNQ